MVESFEECDRVTCGIDSFDSTYTNCSSFVSHSIVKTGTALCFSRIVRGQFMKNPIPMKMNQSL